LHRGFKILLLINLIFSIIFGSCSLILLPKFSFFVLSSFIIFLIFVFFIERRFLKEKRNLEIEFEHLEEKKNLLEEEIKKINSLKDQLPTEITQYRTLGDFQVMLSKYLEPNILCREFLKKITEVFSADNFLIYLINFEKQTLELKFSKKTSYIKEKKGDIIDKQVVCTNKPILIEDIKKDFRFPYEELTSKDRFSSLIAAPISVGDKVYGLIRLESVKAFNFNISDLRFLQTLTEIFSLVLENSFLYKKMKDLAIKDSLTGLYLRNYTLERFNEEIKRAQKFNREISLLLLDIDHFKKCNDTYGHLVGDLVLKNTAEVIKQVIGDAGNIICRLGGEEFLIILPNVNLSGAIKIAEDLRTQIERDEFKIRRKTIKITVSIGIAVYPKDGKDFFSLLQRADKNLYKAKTLGRNKVCY